MEWEKKWSRILKNRGAIAKGITYMGWEYQKDYGKEKGTEEIS